MKVNDMLREHYRVADRMMLFINYGLLLYAITLASWYNTWMEAVVIGGSTAGVLSFIYASAQGSALCRVAMSCGFMVMTALHIHQSHGMIEIHFGVFALLAMLLFYRDGLPIVVAAAVIAVHHLLFFMLQSSGAKVWVLRSTDPGIWVIFLHAAYVIVETALLVWFSIRLKTEAIDAMEISGTTEKITRDNKINLRQRTQGGTALLDLFNGFISDVDTLAKAVQINAERLKGEGTLLADITKEMSEVSSIHQDGTNQISRAVEQLIAAITEVSHTAETAAESSHKANAFAQKASEVSEQTELEVKRLAEQVREAATSIDKLNEHTTEIGGVLDVIRGVAEQTNLLALNAAIEAARAGEQGRGFAVVADEVRTLAQRTQQSTEEIDKMIDVLQCGSQSAVEVIEKSRCQAEHCVDNTRQSLELMGDVGSAIQQMYEINSAIATGAHDQIKVVEEISHSLTNILDASKRAAADSEHAAHCAGTVRNISHELDVLTKKIEVS